MSDFTAFDIVIVGAGIVGASFAALLAKQAECSGLNVALIDSGRPHAVPDLKAFDPRVVALSQQSQNILSKAGAWDAILAARVCPYKRMYVWDADGTGHIEFSAEDIHRRELGYICENSVVLSGLKTALNTATRIQQLHGVSVTASDVIDGGRSLTLSDGRVINTSLVVAADGAHSKLRELGGIDTKEWDYAHTAIVTTVRTERSHEYCAWQRFSKHGPLAFLPLSSDGVESQTASIVWSLCTEESEKMMRLDDDEFNTALGAALEFKLGKVTSVDARQAIPLRQRFAKNYVQPSLALLGDAAHTIHPLAGQGVNLGLYDAAALVVELVRACERTIPMNEMATLRRYERARKPHNLAAMSAMECFKRTFGSDNITLRWLRNAGLNFVDQNIILKKVFVKIAAGNVADV